LLKILAVVSAKEIKDISLNGSIAAIPVAQSQEMV